MSGGPNYPMPSIWVTCVAMPLGCAILAGVVLWLAGVIHVGSSAGG